MSDSIIVQFSKSNDRWNSAAKLKQDLLSDGWASPNTYDAHFAPLIKGSAVYLFMLHEAEEYKKALVAYVGMSVRLSQRIGNHNILPMLNMPGFWPMIWFKPVKKGDLRKTESTYIQKFDPPWNISGRVRGGVLK